MNKIEAVPWEIITETEIKEVQESFFLSFFIFINSVLYELLIFKMHIRNTFLTL